MIRPAPLRLTARSIAALSVLLILGLLAPPVAGGAPEGQMTWAVHVSLAPTWFDPAETVGIITPFMLPSQLSTGVGRTVMRADARGDGKASHRAYTCPLS